MIQLEKPVLAGTMPVVWPTILDLGRDECKRILRKLGELKAVQSLSCAKDLQHLQTDVCVSQSWRRTLGSSALWEPKETWQRTKRICWASSLKSSGNICCFKWFLSFSLAEFGLFKTSLSFLPSQHFYRASSRRGPQGCQRWAPHHHRLSVSMRLFKSRAKGTCSGFPQSFH